jgi:hypothetical protein
MRQIVRSVDNRNPSIESHRQNLIITIMLHWRRSLDLDGAIRFPLPADILPECVQSLNGQTERYNAVSGPPGGATPPARPKIMVLATPSQSDSGAQ